LQNSSHANIFIGYQFGVVNIWTTGAMNTIIDTKIDLLGHYIWIVIDKSTFDEHECIKIMITLKICRLISDKCSVYGVYTAVILSLQE
jgi:hypothetical protein